MPGPLSAAADLLRALLGSAGLGPIPTLGRPSHWAPATRRSAMAATLTTAVEAAWAADTARVAAGLADAGTQATLADGTELLVGRIAFAVEGPAFTLPPEGGDPPEFASESLALNLATCSEARPETRGTRRCQLYNPLARVLGPNLGCPVPKPPSERFKIVSKTIPS